MVAAAIAITLLAAILFIYSVAIRPWHLQWGAGHLDRVAQLPGDELAPHAPGQTTRAIAIAASPEAVWPHLESAVNALAARTGMVVAVAQPPQALALCSAADWPRVQAGDEALDAVHIFYLKPQAGGQTRLLARYRSPFSSGIATRAADFFAGECSRFGDERRMLLAIKEQAESRAGRA